MGSPEHRAAKEAIQALNRDRLAKLNEAKRLANSRLKPSKFETAGPGHYTHTVDTTVGARKIHVYKTSVANASARGGAFKDVFVAKYGGGLIAATRDTREEALAEVKGQMSKQGILKVSPTDLSNSDIDLAADSAHRHILRTDNIPILTKGGDAVDSTKDHAGHVAKVAEAKAALDAVREMPYGGERMVAQITAEKALAASKTSAKRKFSKTLGKGGSEW